MTAGVELEAVPCPLCGASEVVTLGWLRDVALGVPGEFPLARCCACGLLQQNPRVRVEQIHLLYPDDYPRHRGDIEIPRLMREHNLVIRWALASWLGYRHLDVAHTSLQHRLSARLQRRRIEEIFPPWKGTGRLLDVGCATGKFLKLMAAVGWHVAGVEIDAQAASKARSVTPEIFEGDPVDAPFAAGSFDVITSLHVVEHLPNPLRALERMLGWLAPDGLMIVEVPNAAGFGAQLFGRYWSGLDFPRHLVHFTPRTMTAMVSRAGGRIVDVRHRTKPRWLTRSLRYWLHDQPGTAPRLALAVLDHHIGRASAKLALEILLPVCRSFGVGEMVRYTIRPK